MTPSAAHRTTAMWKPMAAKAPLEGRDPSQVAVRDGGDRRCEASAKKCFTFDIFEASHRFSGFDLHPFCQIRCVDSLIMPVNTGFLLDIAPKFHALLVFIEHRFYGESLPFGKHSYKSAKTLGYLNSQQALADYALLIRSLKHNLSCEASPVALLKYPHIAIGALASSAPILQFDDITPWSSYYDGVSQDFKVETSTKYV
ncbi:alpha/beta-Hydrolases superfamily protein [Perilla frutescens var. frutescens]|nr:alpha/beta-Hydrolases superfamily protein [Perilla frutescens var. frutescens]